MRHLKRIILLLIFSSALALPGASSLSQEKLEITHGPYLLDPAEDAVTVVWYTNKKAVSWVEYSDDQSFGTFPTWGGYPEIAKSSHHGLIDAYTTRHSIRIMNLKKGTTYRYRIVSKEILKFNPYEVLYPSHILSHFTQIHPNVNEVNSLQICSVKNSV